MQHELQLPDGATPPPAPLLRVDNDSTTDRPKIDRL
jgi:hypothetical protein